MPDRILVNPALRLLSVAHVEKTDGGGKKMSDDRRARLSACQERLLSTLTDLQDNWASLPVHDGHLLLWIGMFHGLEARSHTPGDLFLRSEDVALRAPWRDGYIVDVTYEGLGALLARLGRPRSNTVRYDITSIESLLTLAAKAYDEAQDPPEWDHAPPQDGGLRFFYLTVPPYATQESRTAAAGALATAGPSIVFRLPDETADAEGDDTAPPADSLVAAADIRLPAALERAVRAVRADRPIIAGFKEPAEIGRAALRGSVLRWEPLASLSVPSPGEGPEPDPDVLPIGPDAPVVGVVDGGYTGNRYRDGVAWRAPALVADGVADSRHGNVVTSILVDANRWNPGLRLPAHGCRIGLLQAVARSGGPPIDVGRLARALDRAMSEHRDTRVWNISANFTYPAHRFQVSWPGWLLNQVARRHDCLLVISSGNRQALDDSRIAPPADCESALVVAGRMADLIGLPGDSCPISRHAFGPDGMVKPELSWFSYQRILGGTAKMASSWATPLIARTAAHVRAAVPSASADLARALMIASADLGEYCERRGYGSPTRLPDPWLCGDHQVVLAWTAKLAPSRSYFWTDIAIPPALVQDGRLRCRIRLVAILEPHLQNLGDQAAATRVSVRLDLKRPDPGSATELLGTILPQRREREARTLDFKWQPVRVHDRTIGSRSRLKVDPSRDRFRVYARVYWRHTYMFPSNLLGTESHPVSFVLLLEALDPQAHAYNEFRQMMVELVEPLPVEVGVEVGQEVDET